MKLFQRIFLPAAITAVLFAALWWLVTVVFGTLPELGIWFVALAAVFAGQWIAVQFFSGRRYRNGQDAALQSEMVAEKLIELVGDLEIEANSEEIAAIAQNLPVVIEEAPDIIRLRRRIDQEKMLRQFSEALNFTINFDAMMWLIYTNCQDTLGAKDFFIYIQDIHSKQVHTAFHYEDGQRRTEMEGPRAIVSDRRVMQTMEMGQIFEHQDDEGRYWMTAPLNAGADMLGALQASHREVNVMFEPDKHDVFNLLAFRTATAIDSWQANKTLQLRAQQLETLNEVIHSINSELDVAALLNLILNKAIELLDVEAGSFLLVDASSGDLEFAAAEGPRSQDLVGTRLPIGTGIAGEVAQTNTPKIIDDVERTKQWFSGVDEETSFHTHSILTVPLSYQRNVLGVLQVINRRNGGSFTESDQLLLMAFAGEAAVALANARLLQDTDEALKQRVRELSLLQELDRDLNDDLDIETTAKETLDWMLRLYAGTAGAIVIFEDDGTVLHSYTTGYDFEPNLERALIDHCPGILGRVVTTGKPELTLDVSQDTDYEQATLDTVTQMTLPIMQEDRVIGAIAVESNQANTFDNETLSSAISIINHITAAISNALLYHQVDAANRGKSEFISVVSHELKTPLTSIRGFADLMMSGLTGDLTDKQREFLTTITSNVNRMSRLIQDLSDVSRADTGQLSVSLEPIPITNIVSETITSIHSLADEKEIQIHLDMLPDPPIIMGDHARLVQVLTNLVSNACKYSPPESDIYVSLSNGNGQVKCTVRDTGYGISDDDQKQLFTRFFRSHDPNIRQASGTGLGLSITRALVELHGGELGFNSQLGEGTSFWFTLPQMKDR